MDMKKLKRIIPALAAVLVIAAGLYFRANRYTPIDEWSSNLSEEKIDWAEAACGYGEEKISYDIPSEEYDLMINVLKTISEENSTREVPVGTGRTEYRLTLHYDGKLWLFNCKSNALVGLTFEDAETGAVYGCEGKTLYINSSDLGLWIQNTVDEKAS